MNWSVELKTKKKTKTVIDCVPWAKIIIDQNDIIAINFESRLIDSSFGSYGLNFWLKAENWSQTETERRKKETIERIFDF